MEIYEQKIRFSYLYTEPNPMKLLQIKASKDGYFDNKYIAYGCGRGVDMHIPTFAILDE